MQYNIIIIIFAQVRLNLTSWPYKKPSAKTKPIETHEMTTTAQQNAAAARDSLKTAELHHRFTQDIRRQIETEYNAAVDEEIAAAGDMDRKRRHAEEMEETHKRVRSDAFRSLVKATGGFSGAEHRQHSRHRDAWEGRWSDLHPQPCDL